MVTSGWSSHCVIWGLRTGLVAASARLVSLAEAGLRCGSSSAAWVTESAPAASCTARPRRNALGTRNAQKRALSACDTPDLLIAWEQSSGRVGHS